MTNKQKFACSLSIAVFTLLGTSAHANIVSGVGFVPLSPTDAPFISYAQGAVTSTDVNFDRSVTADMGFFQNVSGQMTVNVYFVGNGGNEFCHVDTREQPTAVARTYSFNRIGFFGPNLLTASFTTIVGGPLLYVSLRCVLPHTSTSGQSYIFGASINVATH